MSKSVGNVVSPDVVIDAYGADSLRLFEMFLGPLEAVKPWSEKGIEGVHRFLKKVHRECLQTEKYLQDEESDKETLKVLHETILKVTEAIEDLRFNVAISQMMILINQLQKAEAYSKKQHPDTDPTSGSICTSPLRKNYGKALEGSHRLPTNLGPKHKKNYWSPRK